MLITFLTAITASVPAAYELDFRALPATNTVPYYEYVIVMSFKGEPDLKVSYGHGPKSGPEGAASTVFESLDVADGWKAKKDGLIVTLYGYDDVRIQNLKVEGKGPKPLVRRVFVLPPEKK